MITAFDIAAALSILDNDNWFKIDDPEIQEQLLKDPKFEKLALLSNEAKYVVKLVMDTPMELIKAVVGGHPVISKKGMITKYRLEKFLRQKQWKRKEINRVFKELEEYVEDL